MHLTFTIFFLKKTSRFLYERDINIKNVYDDDGYALLWQLQGLFVQQQTNKPL